MEQTIKAIETVYKGYRFRSRLEARWARFFDALGLNWEYEKEGYELGDGLYYLPDFWLPQVNCWAEVKPTDFSDDEQRKAELLVEKTRYGLIKLIGTPALQTYTQIYLAEGYYEGHPEERWEAAELDLEIVLTTCYLHEHRFYYDPDKLDYFQDTKKAVEAARSARFEFGESGL